MEMKRPVMEGGEERRKGWDVFLKNSSILFFHLLM